MRKLDVAIRNLDQGLYQKKRKE